MKKPKTLSNWDFAHTYDVPNGYDITTLPECNNDNFNKLLENYNELVDLVNILADKAGIELEDE